MRSTRTLADGTSGTVNEVCAIAAVGMMIWPAGHSPGQVVGYRVVLRVIAIVRVLVVGTLLWSAPLSVIPQGSGIEPATLSCLLHGMSSSFSLQKRIEFGLSGTVQFTSSSRSNEMPPKICAPAPGRARNSRLYAL